MPARLTDYIEAYQNLWLAFTTLEGFKNWVIQWAIILAFVKLIHIWDSWNKQKKIKEDEF